KVQLSEGLELAAAAPLSLPDLRRSLRRQGFTKAVIEERLLPVELEDVEDDDLESTVDARLQALIKMNVASIAAASAFPASGLRFKLPASADQTRTRAFAQLVEGLCELVAQTIVAPPVALPTDWSEMRRLLFPDGKISLASALDACWKLGVPVFPL